MVVINRNDTIGFKHGAINVYLSEYIDYYSENIIYLTIKSLAKYPEQWSLFGLSNKEPHIFNRRELPDIKDSRICKNDGEIMPIPLFMDDM